METKLSDFYEMAKAIYEGKKDKSTCLKIAFEKYGAGKPSFKHSFNNYIVPLFRYMIEDKTFKGYVGQDLTRYYLERIYADFGIIGLQNALASYKGTIDYYESEVGQNKPGDKRIYEEFKKLLRDTENIDRFTVTNELDETETPDVEGVRKSVFVNVYERSAEARKKCIEHMGCVCAVCGFDFEKVYGELGKGFIHIHHRIPVSSIGKAYSINYETDLVPVCPNCHAMLHRGKNGKVLSIEELREIMVEVK